MPAVTRIGDVDSDGDVMVSGSPNVFANENESAGDIDLDTTTSEFFVDLFAADRPPDISSYVHAVNIQDDEGAPSDVGGEVPFTRKQTYVAAAAKENNVDIKTPPVIEETATVPPRTPLPASGYNYDDIMASTTFPASFQLSPNFTLGMVSSNCRVSKYAVVEQFTSGRKYTVKELVCNLRDLCYHILEPLKQMYPDLIINSGFRTSDGGKSQHERGQAADVALASTDTNAAAAWTVAQAIVASSIPYDQFIFEQNNTIWYHVSYDRTKTQQRGMVLSKPRGQAKPTMGLQRAR